MAYEILEIAGDVMRIRIYGRMRLADQRALQDEVRKLIARGVKPRLLVVTENFAGWENEEGWDDVGFLVEHGDDVVKMAIVGDERWKDQAFLFTGKGLRSTEIEFFAPAERGQADRWLET